MSLKFGKHRSVTYTYFHVPLRYTGIKHRNNVNKELVLIDWFGKYYVAGYRNHNTSRVGRTFLLKKTRDGFIFRGKEIKHTSSGWVY